LVSGDEQTRFAVSSSRIAGNDKGKLIFRATFAVMQKLLFFLCFFLYVTMLFGQGNKLYDQTRVHSVYVTLPADSLATMIDQFVNTRYMKSRFIYDDGLTRDTLLNVGIRLRGNTSLSAQKKSFKLSFNEFEATRKYQGVRKLNLRGSHNDPSMIREKLWFDLAKRAGAPNRRTSFVKLYINGDYRGLYTNLEEIDKEWLEDEYPDDTGNLYKCTFPADLEYQGLSQSTYKAIINSGTTRAYDLVTNEVFDNYSDLVNMMRILDNSSSSTFADSIAKVLNVESVLLGFALDVATGNWDDYFYNKNNYYLYQNPSSKKFEFFAFDTDNSMGIDFLDRDWQNRDATKWQRTNQARPLANNLFKVPAFKQRYYVLLDSITKYITNPDSIDQHIDFAHTLITPAAIADTYRKLDYGYSVNDFMNSITQTIDGHSPWGVKPFFGERYVYTLIQLNGLIATQETEANNLIIYPNPAHDVLYIGSQTGGQLEIYDINGRLEKQILLADATQTVEIRELAVGIHVLRLQTEGGVYSARFLKK
jgi:CotH kinase protein/Secretion system C-terminal sorting domain